LSQRDQGASCLSGRWISEPQGRKPPGHRRDCASTIPTLFSRGTDIMSRWALAHGPVPGTRSPGGSRTAVVPQDRRSIRQARIIGQGPWASAQRLISLAHRICDDSRNPSIACNSFPLARRNEPMGASPRSCAIDSAGIYRLDKPFLWGHPNTNISGRRPWARARRLIFLGKQTQLTRNLRTVVRCRSCGGRGRRARDTRAD
jgi:hypothetical protein